MPSETWDREEWQSPQLLITLMMIGCCNLFSEITLHICKVVTICLLLACLLAATSRSASPQISCFSLLHVHTCVRVRTHTHTHFSPLVWPFPSEQPVQLPKKNQVDAKSIRLDWSLYENIQWERKVSIISQVQKIQLVERVRVIATSTIPNIVLRKLFFDSRTLVNWLDARPLIIQNNSNS